MNRTKAGLSVEGIMGHADLLGTRGIGNGGGEGSNKKKLL